MNQNNDNSMPPWAKKVDDFGQRHCHKEKSFRKYRAEAIWAILLNLVFLYIVNKIPDWNWKFIPESYGAVLWILNMNIFFQIGGNLLIVLFDFHWIRYLSKIIMEAVGFVTTLVLYYIYPFDFSGCHGFSWIDLILPVLFIISMIVSAIKVVANIWKLLFWRH